MTFNKPTEWGSRFSFPENLESIFDEGIMRLTEKIAVQMADNYDAAIVEEIAAAARAAGVSDCTVLNKKAILEAIEKQIPKKPTFVGTRSRNHGRSVADGASIYKCYKCPTCWSHIFHVWDSEKYCVYCGQALDWTAKTEKVKTNADRIRAMSDKELAEFLADRFANESCSRLSEDYMVTATQIEAIRHTWYCCWMEWLKQPVGVE